MIFRRSFAPAGRFARRSDNLQKKHTKTNGFYRFFTCSLFRAHFEIRQKKHPNELLERVARRIALGTLFFRACECQNGPRRLPRAPCEASWDPPGRSWAALGPLLGRSWAFLGALGALLGRSWTALAPLLGGSWAILGAPGPPLSDLGSILGSPGSILLPQEVHFRTSEDGFENELETTCAWFVLT